MARRSLLALATMFATLLVNGTAAREDDSYRRACARVALDGSLCEAREVLEPAGGRYGGYLDGEHRFVRERDACAVAVDDDGVVVRVRYLAPSPSWRAQ